MRSCSMLSNLVSSMAVLTQWGYTLHTETAFCRKARSAIVVLFHQTRFFAHWMYIFKVGKSNMSKQLPMVIMVNQWNSHINSSNTSNQYQSAYRKFQSTETALPKIHNDILASMDAGKVTELTLLDLSAAFDTVDHTILLRRLNDWFGVTGKALDWFKSYLTGKCRRIKLGDCLSSKADLKFGVPEGSVLGPLLFTLYTTPLSSMICEHAIPHHLYDDDSQLYISFASGHSAAALNGLQSCLALSSHGCWWINWNWTQIKLNSFLLGLNDSGAYSSLCFRLSLSVSKLTLLNLLGILV